ncbi:lytic transglycosylase domain-containing protein [Variovorax sp. J22G21]|uniref:lytic transglycosylase domain-containing protein n=1 Tax=Variovorax fucosicus TaxID=3053517 RepID=UPI002574A4AC|nr:MULTISPECIES: lytic transglycosylase domain-containing protein [unclassified Variovorax]MDM0040281.1 lytic transglycosylase domain-containing protein [Variovorax sp. J22R193]MDM0061654.1 lytic transglycosylase domain-containing protein [Variovorax sp. J22G21]
MFPGMEAIACPNLAVPAQVMRHVVHVESGANPFAIGVIGGQVVRQPKTLEEAVATAQMLKSKGYNYSLGAAQVNQVNFRKYGFDTHEKAFDLCANLAAGASILANCYARAGGDWGKAFSCYYSGNFVTGFRSGYVQKIYDSISRGVTLAQAPAAPPAAIPLRPASAPPTGARSIAAVQSTTAASRISMRVVPLDASTQPVAAAAVAATQVPASPLGAPAGASDVFVPQVRHPGAGNVLAPAVQAAPTDRPAGDGAFVF